MQTIRKENLLSLPVILLLFPTLAVFMAVAGFYIGKPVTKWYGVVSFVLCWVLIVWGANSPRNGVKWGAIWTGILLIGFLWSSVLFMNDVTDAKNYHTPATLLLASGWNPLLDATPEALQTSMGIDLKLIHVTGVVNYSKITWIWGAVTTLLTGNVSSSMTSSFFLMISLGIYICRFHQLFFRQSQLWKWLLVILIINKTCIFYMLSGLVDYVIYASLLLCILTATTYFRTQNNEDLVLFGLSTIWLVNAKVSGLLFFMVLCAVLMLTLFVRFVWMKYEPPKLVRFVRILIVAGLFAVFAGSAPYLTNWVHFGSPAYPQHTFNPKREAFDPVKADLTSDEYASQTGYVGKIVGAWFSETAVVAWHNIRTGQKLLTPRIHKGDGFNGLGVGFKVLMWLSILMVALSKRSEVDIAIGLLFLTAISMPTYAIGISRYAPQMWAVPFLAAANMMANPGKALEEYSARVVMPIRLGVRYGLLSFFCVVALASVVLFGRYYIHLIIFAANKMEAYQEIKGRPFVEVLLADTRTSFSAAGGESRTIRLCSNLETFYHMEVFKIADVQNVRYVHSGSINMDQGILPYQCILFQDKGYLLTNSSKQQYDRWVETDGKKINNFSDVKQIPVQIQNNMGMLRLYCKGIYRLRKSQLVGAWCG